MTAKSKKVLLKDVQNVVKSKVVGCNTLAIEYANGDKAIRYHATDVIITKPNGDTVLTSGGYRTVTTKLRFNDNGFRVNCDKGIWYIVEKATNESILFFDDMTFNKEGFLVGKAKLPNLNHILKVKKDIAKYLKKVNDLKRIPFPEMGDCFYCQMKTQEGKPLGDCTNNSSHLAEHLREGYIHGSIIFNALKDRNYRDPAFIMQAGIKSIIVNALRRYLTKRLLPEVQAA